VVMLATVASYLGADEAHRRDALLEVLEHYPGAEDMARTWRELRAKKYRSRDELLLVLGNERQLEKSAQEMADAIIDMLDRAHVHEIELALQAGVLEIDPLGMQGKAGWSPDEVTAAVTSLMSDVLAADSSTYPMFNDLTRGLAQGLLRNGALSGADLAPATQAGIAGRLISGLEAFPAAPMDVVLDARQKLRDPLVRFRAGVIRLSREARVTPLDPQFPRAADELYREHVAPALLEIKELSAESGLLSALRHAVPASARDIAVIAMAVANMHGADDLWRAATATAATAADLIGRTAIRQRELHRERDRNEFVFLYEAERRLRP
jgi:hypothetical protein